MSEARNEVERKWGEHSPSYYRDMAIQPTDFIVANKIDYLPGSIVKYATRAGRKPGEPALKDARKCLAFAKRWVAELEAEAPPFVDTRTIADAPFHEEQTRETSPAVPAPVEQPARIEVPLVEPEPIVNGRVSVAGIGRQVCR